LTTAATGDHQNHLDSDDNASGDETITGNFGSPLITRRNIRHIMTRNDLASASLKADDAERARHDRLAVKKRIFKEDIKPFCEKDRIVLDFDYDTKAILVEVCI